MKGLFVIEVGDNRDAELILWPVEFAAMVEISDV